MLGWLVPHPSLWAPCGASTASLSIPQQPNESPVTAKGMRTPILSAVSELRPQSRYCWPQGKAGQGSDRLLFGDLTR